MIEFTLVKPHLRLVCIQLAHAAEVCMHICIFYRLLAEKAVFKIVPGKTDIIFWKSGFEQCSAKENNPL